MGLRSWNDLLQSPRALRALIAGGSLLGLLVLGLVAAPLLVRGKVERAARERGLEAEVGSVHFGWSAVWLRDVRVTSSRDAFELRLDSVRFSPFSGAVRAAGGSLRGSGDPEAVWARLRGKAPAGQSAPSAGRDLAMEGLFIKWRRDQTEATAFGVRGSRVGAEVSLGADQLQVARGKLRVEVRDLFLGTSSRDGRRRLSRVATRTVNLSMLDAQSSGDSAAKTRETHADGPSEATELGLASRLREARGLLTPLLREGLAGNAELALEGVSARIERGGETLSFGPSRLSVQRDVEQVRVALTPSAAEATVTPLALNLSMPLGAGSVHVVAKGGPVSLQSVGMRVGQLGVSDVRQATLAADGSADFSEDFENVLLDGKLSLHGLVLERKELSAQRVGPWSFDLLLKARARLDGSSIELTSSEARVGELRAELSGAVEDEPGRRRVQGRLRVPLSACQSVLSAVPRGLLPLVSEMRLQGSFGIDLQARYDSRSPKDTNVSLKVQNECRASRVPSELLPNKFERAFMREVKAPDGSSVTIESGPGSPSWVPLDDMSRHVETAILICEDSRFHSHAGFDFRALEDAIKDDLKLGRFARGASTVSMQLAKNLYLGKEKTLGRKLQEALLTLLLEQQLDKRRILELYLNVVELGPGLYGVGDAARYYFATTPRALSLGQALYLASILPNPTFSRFGSDGKLNPQWRAYLHRLMKIAHKIKRIDDAELQAALEEEIAFRVAGPGPGDTAAPADTTELFEPAPSELEVGAQGGP